MKPNRIFITSLVAVSLTLSAIVVAQVKRPYRNGSVWDVEFVRMKAGMETVYLA